MKMNPEVKAEWLAALRSGEYKQATGALMRDDLGGRKAYCCLGVLCDLAAKRGIVEEKVVNQEYAFDEETALLPASVQKWAGVGPYGDFMGMGDNYAGLDLPAHNDRGHSFEEIAKVIEENL